MIATKPTVDNAEEHSLAERLQQLEDRVSPLESQGSGTLAKFTRLGVVVGCIGGLLSLVNIMVDWGKALTAAPNIEADACVGPTFKWDPLDHRLDVYCAIALRNSGAAGGSVTVLTGKVTASNAETLTAPSWKKVLEKEKRVSLPMNIDPSSSRDVELVIAYHVPPPLREAFFRQGRTRLQLNIVASKSLHPKACFYLNEDMFVQLVEKGEATFGDEECA